MYNILRRIFTDCDIIDMYGLYCKLYIMTTNRLYYTTSKIYVQAGTTFKINVESVDGYFSGEKNGVIIQGATMSELYEKCKSFDIASVMEKIKTGVDLNDWEKRLIKVNKKLGKEMTETTVFKPNYSPKVESLTSGASSTGGTITN